MPSNDPAPDGPKPLASPAPPLRLDLSINLTVSDRPLAAAMQHARDKLACLRTGLEIETK